MRVLDTGKGTGAVTRVLVDTTDGEAVWTTIGVSENIIEASWQALYDSVVFGLAPTAERLTPVALACPRMTQPTLRPHQRGRPGTAGPPSRTCPGPGPPIAGRAQDADRARGHERGHAGARPGFALRLARAWPHDLQLAEGEDEQTSCSAAP